MVKGKKRRPACLHLFLPSLADEREKGEATMGKVKKRREQGYLKVQHHEVMLFTVTSRRTEKGHDGEGKKKRGAKEPAVPP